MIADHDRANHDRANHDRADHDRASSPAGDDDDDDDDDDGDGDEGPESPACDPTVHFVVRCHADAACPGAACAPEACQPVEGCFALPVPTGGACGFSCERAATCAEGACAGASTPDCDDQNPCTADTCDGARRCAHAAVPDHDLEPTTCGAGACARTGARACASGAVTDSCVPGAPAARDDTCDGIDDDCDGAIDEDLAPVATTCGAGACARTGVRACASGAMSDSCVPGAPAALDDTCDGIDDDCDGVADEDFLPAVTACGEGPCRVEVASSCVGGVERQDACTPRVEGRECHLLSDLRPGRPKPWEDELLHSRGGATAVSPNGNLSNRVALFGWQPPGVGPSIEVALIHNSADHALQRGAGLGFRLGATLEVRDGGAITVADEDGTPRTFTPDGRGGFVPEVFDTDDLRAEAGAYVLRSPGGTERVFGSPNGLGWVERLRRDRTGDAVTFTHDASDHLIRVEDSAGRAATLRFEDGLLRSATDPEGRVVDLTYDAGRLVRVEGPAVDGARATIALTYSGGTGRIRSRTSLGQANTTSFDYDGEGRLTRFTLLPAGLASRIDYTDGQVALTDPTRRVFVQKLWRGQVIATIAPTGLVTRLARDEAGRTVYTADGHGRTTATAYGPRHDVVRRTDEAGRSWSYAYDDRHNLLAATDPYGDTWRWSYGPHDEVTLATNPLGEPTRYVRDGAGNLLEVVDFAGVTRLRATYNAVGRPLTLTSADGRTSARAYDAYGNLSSLELPGFPAVTRTSTPLDRTLTLGDLHGGTRTFAYDALGRLTRTPYGADGVSTIARDLEGRVTATETTLAGRTERSAAIHTSSGPTSLTVNGATIQASTPRFASVPAPPPASCEPTCALRCGARLGDTCGGVIDCTCAAGLTCNTAGFCVP